MTNDAADIVQIHEVSPLVTEDTRLAPQRKADAVPEVEDSDGEAQPGNPPTDAVTEP